MSTSSYGFSEAWVKAEQEAAEFFVDTKDALTLFNEAEDVIEQDLLAKKAMMHLLFSLTLEIRTTRLFLVATFQED